MSEFKINTGWSVFSILLTQNSDYRRCSVNFGDFDDMVDVSMDNHNRIIDIECICARQILLKAVELPDQKTLGCCFAPYALPDEDSEDYGLSLSICLHPSRRELNVLLYTANPKPERYYKDGRVELYYRSALRYDENAEEWDEVNIVECVRILDLTDEEYAYLKSFCKE